MGGGGGGGGSYALTEVGSAKPCCEVWGSNVHLTGFLIILCVKFYDTKRKVFNQLTD